MQKHKEALHDLSLFFLCILTVPSKCAFQHFYLCCKPILKKNSFCLTPVEQIKDTVLNDDDIGDSCHEDFLHK